VNLYPAIDILGGNAVRLVQGDFDAKKVYDEDPLSAARGWVEQGAASLHVVDLDGARTGSPANLEHLRRIAALGVPVQFGGGLRTSDAIAAALDAGAARVILGTAAFTDEELLAVALRRHGAEQVMVSVDVRGGKVVVDGWTRAADVDSREAFARLVDSGVRRLAYTNVDRDGMLGGLNLDDLVVVCEAAGDSRLVYSGGIGTLADLEQLAAVRAGHALGSLDGVIVGKALYEGRFTVAQAQAALAGRAGAQPR
jgi:phosphoribosylformimino-5-aminoimidazole carboxamide ribotide isomerase